LCAYKHTKQKGTLGSLLPTQPSYRQRLREVVWNDPLVHMTYIAQPSKHAANNSGDLST
jgi:hypothetical protein